MRVRTLGEAALAIAQPPPRLTGIVGVTEISWRAVSRMEQLHTAATEQRTLSYRGPLEGDAVVRPVRVVGLGGSLRAASTSLTALKAGLEGAAAAGAETQLVW